VAGSTTKPTLNQRAARLYGPRDVRIEAISMARDPGPGEAVVRVTAVGICGSDLHTYVDGRVGDTVVHSPIILGHEFAGVVTAASDGALDGNGVPLAVGSRVAVDPARPCGECELCRRDHPNLCTELDFAGQFPTDGALSEFVTTPSACCFPVPPTIDDIQAAMLEPLGIALHAVDLGHIRPGDSAAIVGAGAIGLCTLQVVRQAGAAAVFVTDRLEWRLDAAQHLGATVINVEKQNPVSAILEATGGRGVDVALECAWSSEDAVGQAVGVLRNGGRLVVVGISQDDRLVFSHSAARRRGLTIALCRRMKHTYPRAIEMVENGKVDVAGLVTDVVDLAGAPMAFANAADYRPGIIKAVVRPPR
jgi:L-iditol 2-dehydrogenase